MMAEVGHLKGDNAVASGLDLCWKESPKGVPAHNVLSRQEKQTKKLFYYMFKMTFLK